MKKEPKKKEKTFESGVTLTAIILSIFPIAVAVMLTLNGISNLDKFPYDELFRPLFGYVPLLFALGLVVITILAYITNLGKVITITPKTITYKHGDTEFTTSWEMLAYSAPSGERKFLRSFSIGDGVHYAKVEEIFFPKFNQIVGIMMEAKRASGGTHEV